MPYNTTAIPPKKEPTGQTQLPLSRVKKIISQDSDVQMCSNNAAFIITCAAELFIQHLADEAHTQAKLERKPRRNIQYKDLASAVSHHDHLEFLEDVVPKTVPYKKIKAAAWTTQARLRGENATEDAAAAAAAAATNAGANNRPLTANGTATIVNGEGPPSAFFTLPTSRVAQTNHSNHNATGTPSSASAAPEEDPNQQLELEMRQAQGPDKDADVHMTG